MKTTEEWYGTLNEKYRERALKNMTNPKAKHHSLLGAISNGFDWNRSVEGSEFWIQAFREIRSGVYEPVEESKVLETVEVTKTEISAPKLIDDKVENPIGEIKKTDDIETVVKNKITLENTTVYNSLEEMNFSTKK